MNFFRIRMEKLLQNIRNWTCDVILRFETLVLEEQ
jgi:hypothetical protein